MQNNIELQLIVHGNHPDPVHALVKMINTKEITKEYFLYQLSIPPKLRQLVLSQLANLTDKELKVVEFVKQAKTNKRIAEELGITEGTVKAHLRSIFIKLDVKNRMELMLKEVK